MASANELDANLKRRHDWYEYAATHLQSRLGLTGADVAARWNWCLAAQGGTGGSIDPEACELLTKSINRLVVDVCVKARDNSIQRRSGVIEFRDLLMAIVGTHMGPLWQKYGRTSSLEALTLPGRWDRAATSWNHPAVPPTSADSLEAQAVVSCLADEINLLNDCLSYRSPDITRT